MKFKTISVIGLGYIGLPTAATFASRGLNVIGVDLNQKAVEIINNGGVHIIEPDLDIVVRSVVQSGNLHATTKPEPADAFIIAVPTPFRENKQPDLHFIEAASKTIAPVLRKNNLIILESTSPVGTTEKMAEWLAELRPDLSFPQQVGEMADVCIAYCPERVLPGKVLVELINNDRVIGGMTPKCSKAAVDLYKIFVQGDCVITTARTAEMCKLTENSFRDVNIAFANELSMICDKLNINVWELISLANRHPRVNILQPGPGVGGHCIAVDPWFLVSSAPDEAKLIRSAREINDYKPEWVIEKILSTAKKIKKNSVTVACLGLSFKANIDDVRESPALEIVNHLALESSLKVTASEPNLKNKPITINDNINFISSIKEYKDYDIVVVLVDHKEYISEKNKILECPNVLDFRGILGI
jgi:UDP-N-acetyl-D-mannosaminuronic acid dehydrogenase